VITDLARKELVSWRHLPKTLYQIQTKFRDEIRPRFGLMRGREFIMKDAYSFDLNQAEALSTYKRFYDAYVRIFKRCGLEFRAVEAATGAIGGSTSHEFQVLANSGEDLILSCNACEYAANIEKAELSDGSAPSEERRAQESDPCPRCKKGSYQSFRGIEVGQVFYLGTKYSKSLNAVYKDETGQDVLMEMVCYGIGVSRTASAAIEQHHDDKGIVWPAAIAPYTVHLLPLQWTDGKVREAAENLESQLTQAGIEILFDDRDLRAGVKFNDADLIGLPVQLIVGSKGIAQGKAEIKVRKTGERRELSLDAVAAFFMSP
jgi:prolyl-tRNA synthetase